MDQKKRKTVTRNVGEGKLSEVFVKNIATYCCRALIEGHRVFDTKFSSV